MNALFAPDHVTDVTLSPDGDHLAYVKHSGPVAAVVVAPVARLTHPQTVFADVGERFGRFGHSALSPARVLYLRWASAHTLVYAISVAARDPSFQEELHAVDVLTGKDRKLLDSEAVATTSLPPMRGSRDAEASPDMPDPIAVARHLRVVALDSSGVGAVIVEAAGSRLAPTDVYRVPLDGTAYRQTGSFNGEGRLWYDAQGRLRVHETPRVSRPSPFVLQGMRGAPPAPEVVRQTFEYHTPDSRGRWHPLDELIKGAAFSHDDADFFQPRSFPLGFGVDPNVLYFASNVGRDSYGVYALDVTTGRRTAFAIEEPEVDIADPDATAVAGPLVFDRSGRLVGVRIPGMRPTTRWLDPTLTALQHDAEAAFPGRCVQLLDWKDDRTRVLLLVAGPGAPGRYFLCERRGAPQFTEVLRVESGLNANQLAPAEAFAFPAAAGGTLTGCVTQPRQPRLRPPPLVVICPDVPARAVDATVLHREAQAYAAFGFLVLEVNYRGVDGAGRAHRDAVKAAYDRVPLEDVRAAVAWLAARQPFDPRRVALVGHGFGGLLALRAEAAAPGEFRTVVAFAPPIDVPHWVDDEPPVAANFAARVLPEATGVRRGFFTGNRAALAALSLSLAPAPLPVPVLVIADARQGSQTAADTRRWREALRRQGTEPDVAEMSLGAGPNQAGASAVLRAAEFINTQIYDYRVDVGKEREVK